MNMQRTISPTPSVAAPSQHPKIVRCAIYTRKSTSAGLDTDFNSLDAQRDACLYFIRSQAHANWTHTLTFDDGGYSGANTERPGFQRLLEAVAQRQVDIVIVYKVDRLSRSLSDFSQIMKLFQEHQAAFVSVTQNFSTADAIGRLTLNMLMSFAEFEREMISERTRDKIAGARRRGLWTGGSVPFGYRNDNGHLLLVPDEASVVNEIFQLHLDHHSALSIAKTLNARACPSRARVRKTRPDAGGWCKASVLRALQNPVYIGKIPYQNELFDGEHDAIVDPEVFARAQYLLARPARQRIQRSDDEYLLRGLLKCGCCEATFTGAAHKNNQGRAYRYYRCTSRDRHGCAACPSKPLPAIALEELVVQQLRGALCQEPFLSDVFEGTRLRLASESEALHRDSLRLPQEIAILASQLRTLVGQQTSVGGELGAQIETTARSLDALRTQLDQCERRKTALQYAELDMDWVRQILGNFDECWRVLSILNKQRLLRALIAEVVVNESKSELKVHLYNFLTPEPSTQP
jgi:site-specific DNA recombinase